MDNPFGYYQTVGQSSSYIDGKPARNDGEIINGVAIYKHAHEKQASSTTNHSVSKKYIRGLNKDESVYKKPVQNEFVHDVNAIRREECGNNNGMNPCHALQSKLQVKDGLQPSPFLFPLPGREANPADGYYVSYEEEKSCNLSINEVLEKLTQAKNYLDAYYVNVSYKDVISCNVAAKSEHDLFSELIIKQEELNGNDANNPKPDLFQGVQNWMKQYKCDKCDVSHNGPHESSHKPFKCNKCDKCFSRKAVLKRHGIVHSSYKPFQCTICEKCFAVKEQLKRHNATVDCKPVNFDKYVQSGSGSELVQPRVPNNHKPYKCDKCEARFNRMSDLKRHDSIHTGYKPFVCGECGKSFSQKYDLSRHERVHTKCDKCFKILTLSERLEEFCSHCDKYDRNFITMEELSNDRSVVSYKQFRCNVCNGAFTRRSDLKRHERIHSGVKPYRCDRCGKVFSRNCDLKRHEGIHDGRKRFKCNKCEKSFVLEDYLRKHLSLHTPYKGFKPPQCTHN